MLLILQAYILIFVTILGNCATLHEWKNVLPYLNIKNLQESWPSLSEVVNNTLCTEDFQMYVNQINESYWAMQMFDSSTKFPESILMGQTVFLGNFDECLAVEGVETDSGSFKGQHCLVALLGTPAQSRAHELYDVPGIGGFREYKHGVLRNDRMATLSEAVTDLTVSYCIPSTCTAKDLADIFNSYLKGINSSITAVTTEDACQTNEEKELGIEDWVAIGVFAVFLLLNVASTAYDLLKKGLKTELLITFSLYSNGKKLLTTKSSEDNLHAINGMRFITICWVVWGHRYQMDSTVPSINFNTAADFIQDSGRLYITNGTLSVDTFLVISGLLVSYVFLKRVKNSMSCFNVPLYYVHRYIRLTPPYAVVILFVATLYRHVGSGPLLPAVTSAQAEDCQNYWWTNILYINNYVAIDNMCIGQSWYLSVDMQLFILSPILLYPLWKWPRKWNYLLLGILTIAGIVSPFTISYVNELSANLIYGNLGKEHLQDELYLSTHSRFGPWVIGVTFGYIIYEAKKKELKFSAIQIIIGWIVSNVAMLGSLNGIVSFYQPDENKTVLESAFYNGLFRNVWALGVGITILLCVTGHGGPPNVVLSWKIFPTLGRLSYCIYLIHANYQVVQSFNARTPIYLSDLTEWPAFFGDGLISLILALILHLTIEAPAITLERCLLGRGRRPEQNTQVGALPELQVDTEDLQENRSFGKPDSAEDPNGNFTGVNVEEIHGESTEQLIKE